MSDRRDGAAVTSIPRGPLEGVRVLELGTLIAGPMAGRVFADFGAEVIKVERPISGDPMRSWGKVRVEGRSMWWAVQSRGKKAIAVDLRTAAGSSIARQLAVDADVLLDNFRPGTLERLGLGPDVLWELNPGLVIARISGYGQTGPDAQKPGYASVAEAVGGLRYLNGYPDQPPPRSGVSLGDSLASLYAVQGVLLALYWRDTRSGLGQLVDVSLVESCFSLLDSAVPDYGATSYVPHASGARLDGIAPSNIYRCADGDWVVIAANQDSVFQRLAEAIEQPELATDPRYRDHVARGANQDELDAIIGTWAAERLAAEARAVLELHEVPVSGVNSIKDIFEDPMFEQREMLVPVPDEQLGQIVHPGIVPKLSRTPGAIRWNGPADIGTHTAQVLGERLGFTSADVARLHDRGVVRQRDHNTVDGDRRHA